MFLHVFFSFLYFCCFVNVFALRFFMFLYLLCMCGVASWLFLVRVAACFLNGERTSHAVFICICLFLEPSGATEAGDYAEMVTKWRRNSAHMLANVFFHALMFISSRIKQPVTHFFVGPRKQSGPKGCTEKSQR